MTVYNENNVPILFLGEGRKLGLSDAGSKAVEKAKKAALDSDSPKLLLGESVLIHNADPDGPAFTSLSVGASDLHQAVTECIGAHDAHLGAPDQSQDHLFPPEWVASTHKELAQHLADYYSCEVRDIAEVI